MEEQTFQTSDLTLATFLYAKGVILREVLDTPDIRRKVFVFSEPPPELLAAFQSGNADINVLAFNNAQNTLRGLVNRR